MGSDVLLQPSTLQADNHKKRTGFGPQQASFGVYLSNAFGGMSGALNLGGIGQSGASDGTLEPHVIELAADGSQTGLDITETLSISQLREGHREKLVAAGKIP